MATIQVSIQEAQGDLAGLIARALSGEEIVIADEARPLVRLATVAAAAGSVVPEAPRLAADGKPLRTIGWARGLITNVTDDFDAPLEDFEEYMFTDAELAERRAARAAGKPMPLE